MNMFTSQPTSVPLSDEWLEAFVTELDSNELVGIVLGGSYARGNATTYSDVDFACIARDNAPPTPKRYIYRNGHLVSIGTKKLSDIRHSFMHPFTAFIVVPAMREIRILLDKDGSVTAMREEACAFRWEMIQEKANELVSIDMVIYAEMIHKLLNCLQSNDESALAFVTAKMLNMLTNTMAVQRGILVKTDSTFYQQVYEAIGLDSAWTRYHRMIVGLAPCPDGMPLVKAHAVMLVHLYHEMVELVRPVLQEEHVAVIEECLHVLDAARSLW